MQLLHQTISKLKGFKEWFDTLDLHESQLVLGLSGSVKHLAESCAFEKLDKQLVIVTPTLLKQRKPTKSYRSGMTMRLYTFSR